MTRDSESLVVLGNPLPTCAVCGAVITGHHDCVTPLGRTSVAPGQHEIRVTWHTHEPRPGEGRSDLAVLMNRGDWSVPWVRREVARLFADVARLEEGLRWIVAGKTGSYGSAAVFANAILSEQAEAE